MRVQSPRLPAIPPERIDRLHGFGMASWADGYVYRPTTVEEAREAFALARRAGRQVTLRGAGRSYGDANIGAECVVLDFTRMNRILRWDRSTGQIEVEPGVSIEQIWRHTLEDGWWPPVVSGTMYPTIGGALAMNIHGKNNFREGTLGEHALEIDVVAPDGRLLTLSPADEAFFAVIGGAGLLGAIVRAKLQLKRVPSGDVKVLPVSCRNLGDQFAAFERFEAEADYMVSWVDCFARGGSLGRGLFHAAWYAGAGESVSSLRPEHQDLPSTLMGFFPKSLAWRLLKLFNNRADMRRINAAKFRASRLLGDSKMQVDSLVGFSFLLDYVPDWRLAYAPGGFIQYQSFVPKERAPQVFERQIAMQQEARLESYLAVLKRHRPDRFLLSHAVDGYSLALDFKVSGRSRESLWRLCHRMNEEVIAAGGRFYLAKDSTMRPEDARRTWGQGTLDALKRWKSELDPGGLLTSEAARRLRLFED
jgi:decaprenylphospho-beta-D-ribofuranose 2-oxidase